MTDSIRSLIQLTLLEGKVEDLTKKYPDVDVEHLAKNDPSPTKKYLEWMCKRVEDFYDEGGTTTEVYNDLIPTVKYFHDNIQRFPQKDILQFKSLKELENAVKDISSKKKSKSGLKGNAEKLYEDEFFLLVRPDDKNASITYGANTKWCVTMRDAQYYEQYTDSNVLLYFLISKQRKPDDKFAKVAFAIHRNKSGSSTRTEIFDALDTPMKKSDLGLIAQKAPEFLKMSVQDADKQPNAFLIRLKTGEDISDKELFEYLERYKIKSIPKYMFCIALVNDSLHWNKGIPAPNKANFNYQEYMDANEEFGDEAEIERTIPVSDHLGCPITFQTFKGLKDTLKLHFDKNSHLIWRVKTEGLTWYRADNDIAFTENGGYFVMTAVPESNIQKIEYEEVIGSNPRFYS